MKNLVPYWLRIELRRAHRSLLDVAMRKGFARDRADADGFDHVLTTHSSLLVREVPPEFMELQRNKVQNLRLACVRLDGLVIHPGEEFSFCSVVGRTTRAKGYVDGLEMHQGELIGAPGGGVCQVANMLYWMALNLDLEILERHRHETDLFPDNQRKVPFGMGATVFYNYRDLRFRNVLDQDIVLKTRIGETLMEGAIVSDKPSPVSVEIFETSGRFVRESDSRVWRENHVAKRVQYADGRPTVEREIAFNRGLVFYEVPADKIESVSA